MKIVQIFAAGIMGAFLLTPMTFAEVLATGGTVVDADGYRTHTFTSGDTLTVSAGGNVEVLVVGGGGGGGAGGTGKDADPGGGGGGAGGLIYSNAFPVGIGSTTVTVGAGGGGGSAGGAAAGNGGNSSFLTLTAVGGGRAASAMLSFAASSGGSGGGGAYGQTAGGAGTGGQGNRGGNVSGRRYPGGSGGGAGAAGLDATTLYADGLNGGVGLSCSISGTAAYYAGGGGSGGGGWWTVGSNGGTGGGGAGGGGGSAGSAGTANTGGGGGGGGCANVEGVRTAGGNGGSGIVIVRYAYTPDVPVIANTQATNVQATAAYFNGYLSQTGATDVTVSVLWDETDHGTVSTWPNTNSFTRGQWVTGDYPTLNITTLTQNKNYYYTYFAQGDSASAVASPSEYLITGDLTVQASDPIGRADASDNAQFSVIRPDTCTNDALKVYYTLGGTATLTTDYAISPASGSVIIAAGQTNGLIMVTPVWKGGAEKSVILNLASGPYPVGTPASATCTLATVAGPNAPSDLTATAFSSVQINLAWTDNSSNENNFKIQRAPDVSGSPGTWSLMATVAANTTNHLSTGLAPATKYHYRVLAYSSSVNADSDPSNEANATTPAGSANNGHTWTGMADTSWGNVNNWLVNGVIPGNCPGNKAGGGQGDAVYFGGRNASANSPLNNIYSGAANRIAGMTFQDAWTLYMNQDLYVGDGDGWINMTGGVNAGIDGGGRVLLFYNPVHHTVAAGNTLTIGPLMEFLNNNKYLNYLGGGTIKVMGSMRDSGSSKERADTRAFVSESGTTLELDSKLWLGAKGTANQVSAGNVAAGSILSGNGGGISAGGASGGRTYDINGSVMPGTPAVAVGTLDFAGIQTLNLNGTYGVDVTAVACDKITFTTLSLGAASQLVVSGTASAKVYEIATYSSLTGTFNVSTSVLPPHYKLDYAYNGENKIALVKQPYGTIMTFY